MPKNLMFIELFLFHALVLGWAFWEYRKTSALHKKTLEEERAKAAQDDAAAKAE